MKKTWNKLIIVSFIVLAVVACAAIVFLYPYYNEYKVFDGIEAGQWNEVQKSYEALDSEKQKAVQEMLPDSDPRKKLVSKDLITYVADRKGHDRRYAIAPDKIKAEIGWEPETMFKDGIRQTIKWYFDHEDWMEHVTSGDYQKYYAEMYQ